MVASPLPNNADGGPTMDGKWSRLQVAKEAFMRGVPLAEFERQRDRRQGAARGSHSPMDSTSLEMLSGQTGEAGGGSANGTMTMPSGISDLTRVQGDVDQSGFPVPDVSATGDPNSQAGSPQRGSQIHRDPNHSAQQMHSLSAINATLDRVQAVAGKTAEAVASMENRPETEERGTPFDTHSDTHGSSSPHGTESIQDEVILLRRVRELRRVVRDSTRELVDSFGMETFLEFFDFSAAGGYKGHGFGNVLPGGATNDSDTAASLGPKSVVDSLRSPEYRSKRFAAAQAIRQASARRVDMHHGYRYDRAVVNDAADDPNALPPPPPMRQMRAAFAREIRRHRIAEDEIAREAAVEEKVSRMATMQQTFAARGAAIQQPRQQQAAVPVPAAPEAVSNPVVVNGLLQALGITGDQPKKPATEVTVRVQEGDKAADNDDEEENSGDDGEADHARRMELAKGHVQAIQAQVMLAHVMHAASLHETQRQHQIEMLAALEAQEERQLAEGDADGAMATAQQRAAVVAAASRESSFVNPSMSLQHPPGMASLQRSMQLSQQFGHLTHSASPIMTNDQSSFLDPIARANASGSAAMNPVDLSSQSQRSALKRTPGGTSTHSSGSGGTGSGKKTPTFVGVDGGNAQAPDAVHTSTMAERSGVTHHRSGMHGDVSGVSSASTDDPGQAWGTRGNLPLQDARQPQDSDEDSSDDDTDGDDSADDFPDRSPSNRASQDEPSPAASPSGGGPSGIRATMAAARDRERAEAREERNRKGIFGCCAK